MADFFETLERTRSKPEETRRRITIIIVSIIMFFVIAIWAYTINFSIKSGVSVVNNGPGPWEIFSNSVKFGNDKLKAGIQSGAKAIFKNEEYNNN